MNYTNLTQLIILEEGFDREEFVFPVNYLTFNTSNIHIVKTSWKVIDQHFNFSQDEPFLIDYDYTV